MHTKVAADAPRTSDIECPTLELGAGTLNHLPIEPYTQPYDIVEPFKNLYQQSDKLSRVRRIYTDISEIDSRLKYDRIVSIATFEHVCNLPEVVARCGLLLSQRGTLRVGIPSEGTLLWTLAWKVSTGLEFKLKYGLDYGLLMEHEHVNTSREIEDVLDYFFSKVSRNYFGVARSLSLYQFFECGNANHARCAEYLSSIDQLQFYENNKVN